MLTFPVLNDLTIDGLGGDRRHLEMRLFQRYFVDAAWRAEYLD
jgi:hypothetical protein